MAADTKPTIALDDLEAALYDESSCINPDDVPGFMLAIVDRVKPSYPNNEWLQKYVSELQRQQSDDDGSADDDEEEQES